MRIVVSYAREDRPVVDEIVATLTAMGHSIWSDAGAHSGSRWWDEIIREIQRCDILLATTSPDSLTSKACAAERIYALQLRRHLLPVLVRPVDMQRLPSDLAQVNFFDFTQPTPATAAKLFQTIGQFPPAPPLPHPPPPPPPTPLSYLNSVADRLAHLPPDVDEQHRIVTALSDGLRSPDSEEREAARGLIQHYLAHPHRLPDPADRAQRTLAAAAAPAMQQPGPSPPPAPRGSRMVTALAWVGGVTLALILLAAWAISGSDEPGTDTGSSIGTGAGGVIAPPVVSAAVYADLVAQGRQPGIVSCGALSVAVGATTFCTASDLPGGGATVTVMAVQGGNVTGWSYS